MSLNFLAAHGACRMRNYNQQPIMLYNDADPDKKSGPTIDTDYEERRDNWKPISVGASCSHRDWEHRPLRFIDGKDAGRVVAWLRTPEGQPIPVRLSQIGAVVMLDDGGRLRREYYLIDQVVSMYVDPFPWEQVEGFARDLRQHGFKLLTCQKSGTASPFDFEVMRKNTESRSTDEMFRLERQAVAFASGMPTLVDGPIDKHFTSSTDQTLPVVGVIKSNWRDYLHPHGWQVFYDLEPGQRTPAFVLQDAISRIDIVTWYLRLEGRRGDLPNWGIVRVEIPQRFFEERINKSVDYLNRLSRLVCDYRCRDEGYSRAPVSLHPIQRAEESLGALFAQPDALISHFYHLSGL